MVSRTFCRAERIRLACIALSASALAVMLLPVKFATPAEAKTPGSTYCYYGVCHRVKTIEETRELVGVEETITASHYDDCSKDRYNPCGLTSSGERFHPDRPDNTASPIYPDGTTLLVWSPETERALVVRVNNAGPYWGDRTLDLSRAAAEKLGFDGKGVATLRVRVVRAPEPEEATYVENRNYRPVPGDIGEYDSLHDAQYGMAVALALQASAASPLAPVTTANAFASGTERSEMLVAEAPQSLGRAHGGALVEPARRLASLTLGGHDTGGTLFKSLFQPSVAQSRREVASLSLDRELKQSVWGEDQIDPAPANEPAATEREEAPSSITTSSIDKSSKESAKERAKAAAAEERRSENNDDEERAERPSRKSRAHTERRSHGSRSARYERSSRSREQAEFSERSYERRPERTIRSAEQITSLGIRAQASSM
jgi:rare lipoprotein A (peptidoglycan hydrolase)